ncbi:saccharopine dehydrogenase family protein [Streptacidiphilus cavernicola]|uniref:Trans-acting enoyl reductase family protein n=1 Tax=Streptacidiphilus cavernicola TaxID=3342716 RepID=A0ABV6VSA9_9ACTN
MSSSSPLSSPLPTAAHRERTIVVFGAYGHTGRFVVAELRRRGHRPVLAGRDRAALRSLAELHPGSETRVASADDARSLDRALDGAELVINCAGPFIDTAAPLIDAAIRAGAHYLDVAAEQRVALAAFDGAADRAREAGIAVIPAMAYYGGLADLLATAVMGDWATADEIRIGHALDSWQPTRGTRETGRVNSPHYVVFTGNRYTTPPQPAARRGWDFPVPFGPLDVTELSTADQVTIPRHLAVPEVRVYMNDAPLRDLRDPVTPEPVPTDATGRSAQVFVVEAVVRRGAEERRAHARGQDIYAVTAPLVVEAAERVLDGRCKAVGVVAPGEAFDPEDFLTALAPQQLTWQSG